MAGDEGPTVFRLTHQVGVRQPADSAESPLVFPFVAQWTDFGTCLIVDRRLPANRVLEVDRAGRVCWTFEAPPRLNFACCLGDGRILYTHGDTIFTTERGGSPRPLRTVNSQGQIGSAAVAGDVVAVGHRGGIDVVGLDGRYLYRVPSGETTFRDPVDIQLLDSGGMLVADGETSCVVELDQIGNRVRVFGRWRAPGRRDGRLNLPISACRTRDGRTLVAEWRAHRIAAFGPGSQEGSAPQRFATDDLFAPSYVRERADGHVVVAESGSRRVSLLAPDGRVCWQFGPGAAPVHTLSFPRHAQPIGDDTLLVCDSYHDRVLEMTLDGTERWAYGDGAPLGHDVGLSIPRCATRHPSGLTAIADGLNGRVLVVDRRGRLHRVVDKVQLDARVVELRDPHHCTWLDSGEVLLVDADLGAVFMVDEHGDVRASWGTASGELLADPHQASILPDGHLLVADSGNDRIVELDGDGAVRWQLTETVGPGGEVVRFGYPRYAELLAGRTMLIVDSDNNRVARIGLDGRVHWSVGPILEHRDNPTDSPELRAPKSAQLDQRGRLLVTDYHNCRVVVLTPSAGLLGPHTTHTRPDVPEVTR